MVLTNPYKLVKQFTNIANVQWPHVVILIVGPASSIPEWQEGLIRLTQHWPQLKQVYNSSYSLQYLSNSLCQCHTHPEMHCHPQM